MRIKSDWISWTKWDYK